MPYTKEQLDQVNKIAASLHVSATLVKMLLGVTQPARAALRMQLTTQKSALQGKIASLSFTEALAKKSRAKLLLLQTQVSAQLSLVKRVFNQLNIGPDFQDDPEVQKLINVLIKAAHVKGVTITGYQDLDNIVEGLNYKVAQTIRSADFATERLHAVNNDLDFMDKIIAILDQL